MSLELVGRKRLSNRQRWDTWGSSDNPLTYRGRNLFDIYINAISKLGEELGVGSSYKEEWEDDYGYCEEVVTVDGQESYLGYSPSQDRFYSGWDMWGNDFGVVSFKFDADNNPIDIRIETDYDNPMFYGNGRGTSNYDLLHKKVKDIIDIRSFAFG